LAEYVLDTDHLSYVQEGHPKVVERLAHLSRGDRVFTSVVGVAELLRGVYLLPKGRRQRELLQLYRQVLGQMEEVLPLARPVAERFAEIEVKLRKKGKPIPVNDVWVAALALVRGAVLVTNDEHFAQVDGLKIENWTQ
jgi:predicted nucleic acid-binding protein